MRTLAMVAVLMVWLGGAPTWANEYTLEASLGVSEAYNDNIFFSFDDEVDDYINRLLGGLKWSDRAERLALLLSGLVENIHYAASNDLDGVDQNYAGGLDYRLTPDLRMKLDGAFARDTQPDRDIAVTGFLSGTATRDTSTAGASLEYQLNEITASLFSHQYTEQRFDRDGFIDHKVQSSSLGLTRRLDRFWCNTTGRLNLNYARYDFDKTGIDYYAGTLGVRWQMSELWHMQIDGGVRYTTSAFEIREEPKSNDGWGPVASLAFGYRGKYTSITLALSHDIGAASGRDGSVERTSGVVDLRYWFTEKVWAGITAGYYLNQADANNLALHEIDEETLNVRPFIRMGLLDHLALEAWYGYSQIKDNEIDDTRQRNMGLLKLVFDYPSLV